MGILTLNCVRSCQGQSNKKKWSGLVAGRMSKPVTEGDSDFIPMVLNTFIQPTILPTITPKTISSSPGSDSLPSSHTPYSGSCYNPNAAGPHTQAHHAVRATQIDPAPDVAVAYTDHLPVANHAEG
jgi:hypothetical protein